MPPGYQGAPDKGYLFPWQSSRIAGLDARNARAHVLVDLAPDDLVFGFYSYAEMDLVYRNLDMNPFSNPAVKDRIIYFFHKDQPTVEPERVIYHEIRDAAGTVIATSDPSPATGTRHIFGSVVVGFSIGVDEFAVKDARRRGGGLAPEFQSIEQAIHMWDLGCWDGKPYPIGAALVILLPESILARFTRDEVKAKVAALLPMGALPVMR